MKKHKKNVHLVCNAHLDPVWQWRWPEGAGEALSTFRVAVELIKKNKTFVFNHNESILYEWVEEYDPELFAEIQKYVKSSQWNIMGGWYLQPDCNMPSGESFVRQIARGKRYFQEKFGKDITTAINFDPFGHSRGLVQILAKTGFDSYLFGRPKRSESDFDEGLFIWRGYEGSEVTACRFLGWYMTFPGTAKKAINERTEEVKEWDPACLLWGIGNHGGGPSKEDLKGINELIRERKDINLMHSTPQAFFAELMAGEPELAVLERGLNPWAVGCYTSLIRIKQKHRELENELYSAEKICTAAWLAGLMDYPTEGLETMEIDLLRSEFHDALPGSCIQIVEEDTLRQLDRGLEIAHELKTKAFICLCNDERKAKDGDCPLLIYNPHPFEIERLIEAEVHLRDKGISAHYRDIEVYKGSKRIASQVEKEANNTSGQWRKKVVISEKLKPGMNRFDCKVIENAKRPKLKCSSRKGHFVFKTKQIDVAINKNTGLMDRYRVNGKDVLDKGAFRPLIIEDDSNSWKANSNRYGKVCDRLKAANKTDAAKLCGLPQGEKIDAVRVIENGDLRTIIEAVLVGQNSSVIVHYKLPKVGSEIEVDVRLYCGEKDKVVKLSLPLSFDVDELNGQDAYGVKELRTDGIENVSQKWMMACNSDKNVALSVINDGIYGSDFKNNSIRLSLARTSAYTSEDRPLYKDRFIERMDQGERRYRFWINASGVNVRKKSIDREAIVRNEKEYILNFFPSGSGKKIKPAIVLSDDVVQVPVLKKAVENDDIILRLFEPTGRKRKTKVSMPLVGKFPKNYSVELEGFEVKTLRVNPRTGKVAETDLLENKLK